MRFEDEFLPVLYDFKSAASSSSWAGGPGGKAKGYVPGPEAAGRRAGLQELATGGKGAASSTRGGAVVPGEAATGTGGSSATGTGSSGANISSAAAGAEEDVTMGERNTLKNAAGDYSTALAPGRTRRKRNSLEPLEDCKSEYPLTVLPENLHTNAFVLSSVAEKFFQTVFQLVERYPTEVARCRKCRIVEEVIIGDGGGRKLLSHGLLLAMRRLQ